MLLGNQWREKRNNRQVASMLHHWRRRQDDDSIELIRNVARMELENSSWIEHDKAQPMKTIYNDCGGSHAHAPPAREAINEWFDLAFEMTWRIRWSRSSALRRGASLSGECTAARQDGSRSQSHVLELV